MPPSYVIPVSPSNPYNPKPKLPKDGLNMMGAEESKKILGKEAYILIIWMHSGV